MAINNVFSASNSFFEYGGKEYRNLEAQVQENKEQIAKHWNVDRVLADFGITVRGRLDSTEELEQIDTTDFEYGYAYLIGTAEPYNVYIWTRADVDAGQPDPYWLNIGHIAIEGPTGPQGPEGPQGPQGEATEFLTGTGVPSRALRTKPAGTLYLRTTTGDVYQKQTSGSWTIVANITGPQGVQGLTGPQGERGPQGIQGLAGPQGAPGKSVHIVGIVENIDQLPDAATTDYSYAYLVTVAENAYKLYIINSYNTSTGTTYYWQDAGFFNSGTVVLQDGSAVSVFDADEYLKIPTASNGVVFGRDFNGNLTGISFGTMGTSGTLVQRTTNSQITLPNQNSYEPSDNQAVSKSWVTNTLYSTEDAILTSPYRSAQMTVLTASSGFGRYISNLVSGLNFNIDGARIVIYFPSEQGKIDIWDSADSDTGILLTYRWDANTGCRWAEITIESTGYEEYTVTFKSGDGKVAQVIERQTTGYIAYDLWDEVLGNTGSPYREEITYYSVSSTLPTGITYPQ